MPTLTFGRKTGGLMAMAAAVAISVQPVIAQTVDEVIDIQNETVERGQDAQRQINQIDDQTGEITSQYRALLEQLETQQIYNRQLETLIEGQEQERQRLNRSIDRVTTIERDVTPLMLQMATFLGEFVESDVPFLMDERRQRVERIQELMDSPNATNAEKFRRVLESYQIENEYGRTIEAYPGSLEDGRAVNFLRIGRVALIYQTQDGEEAAIWNNDPGSRGWQMLGDDARLGIRQAFRIAQEQVAPDLVVLPMPTPSPAQ